jgi:acetyltransferase-like isoleucine patch superfamily enzyme/acyl carrier protein
MRRTHALLHAVHRLALGSAAEVSIPVAADPLLATTDGAFVARVREIASSVVPGMVRASAHDDLAALGWDSLARVRVHAALETALGIILEPGTLAVEPMTLGRLAASVAAASGTFAGGATWLEAPTGRPGATTTSHVRKLVNELSTLKDASRARLVLVQGAMRLLPAFTLAATRAQLLRLAGCDLDRSTAILGRVYLQGKGHAAGRLHIGRGCTIAPGVTFGLDAEITVGDNVSIGPFVVLHTATHELGPSWRRMTSRVCARPIVVEAGAWIGMGAMILAGSRLGRGCVVSAGAVVSGDVGPDELVAGNPAVVVDHLPAIATPAETGLGAPA